MVGVTQEDDGNFEEEGNDGEAAEELDELLVVIHDSFWTSPPTMLTTAVTPLSVKMTLMWLFQEP